MFLYSCTIISDLNKQPFFLPSFYPSFFSTFLPPVSPVFFSFLHFLLTSFIVFFFLFFILPSIFQSSNPPLSLSFFPPSDHPQSGQTDGAAGRRRPRLPAPQVCLLSEGHRTHVPVPFPRKDHPVSS